MSGIRYAAAVPRSSAFTPIPVGGGHATPASVGAPARFGYIVASKFAPIDAPYPPGPLCDCSLPPGSTSRNSRGGPPWIRPDLYVTCPDHRPPVKFSPLQSPPTPVPFEVMPRVARVVFRPPTIGGPVENTPWPRTFQSYLQRGPS